ncbi:uncharacterized protein AMSG_01551 [Thecamonas trahens ATCC 50062]|uniref:Uncharacterized protein n=1 Tax=Thecamonas trahens ATCC 50062 TaxID=461836 RepID=A0A0L0DRR1_THETB|nr:hypothetical protein AMSG_01551 [Thecamonas trahens ATCC 50062]KNC54701.1 hypothetical protein AMSG_01551 [Thecamonas trahens ATCC 50062]|eukprot:XP_013761601.1 hypothetical protein AMSG_01551 [Thecamonas trahens ATCC 50062]
MENGIRWMAVMVMLLAMMVVCVERTVGQTDCGTLTECGSCAENTGGIVCGWCNGTMNACLPVVAEGNGYRGNCTTGNNLIIQAPFCDPDYEPVDPPSKSTADQIRDWFDDNLLYVIAGIIIIIFLCCLCCIIMCIRSRSADKKKEKKQNAAVAAVAGKGKGKDKQSKEDKTKAKQKAALAAIAGTSAGASAAGGAGAAKASPAPASASLDDVKLDDLAAEDMVDDMLGQDDNMFL